ncbi:type IV pilus secretin PilQ [Thermodesulfovibrio sp.]|uniref:type IV pilus secretin PilQ n=1 Tax=Thermodesulfovibrio sp. TaxID=2067987 RepID=UPI0030B516B3
MINKIVFFILSFLIIISVDALAGQIDSVVYEDDALKIKLSDKAEHRIIPQDDPFKIQLELISTSLGSLNRKMLFHNGYVSEVSGEEIEKNTHLTILLAEPIKPEIKSENNVIIVSFKSKNEPTPVKATRIIDLLLEKYGEDFEVTFYADGELPEPTVIKTDNSVSIEFADIKFDAEIPKDFPLSMKREGKNLNFSFLKGDGLDAEVLHLGDEVVFSVKRIKDKKPEKAPEKANEYKISTIDNSTVSNVKSDTTVNFDFQDADLVGVFRLLGEISGYNMVIHPEVKGKITLKLINVPWAQALDMICKTFQLQKVVEGNIIRIAPLKVFQEEKKLQAETKDLFKKAEDTNTKIFTLKYALPDKVKTTIEGAKILSPQGNIVVDDRTRSVIVKDIPSVLKEVETFIVNLDKPIRQILLETRIVEISSSFAKSLGFEWGIRWSPPGSRTNIVGSQSSPATVPGGTTPIGINLPASSGAVGAGTSAFTIGYINASGTFALDVRISALQETGKGKIISNPRIITMDNQKAKIVQGESIPYGEKDVQSGQISTKFKDVAVIVETTPHLIDDKSLQLDINVTKEDLVEFVNIGGTYAPRTTKLEGNTKVSLKDGETLVIGGIYKKKDTTRDSKVPLLGDIPLAGELFKSTGRDESLYEVMIFITPRILSYE